MATEVNLTDGSIRATTAAGSVTQSMSQAVDVSKGDQADMVLHVLGNEGGVTVFVVALITGMSMESEDAWVELGTFASNVTANLAEKKNFTGLLKYYRWKVKTITGGTAITFTIRGMVRTN
jgi:hypothetical protein